MDRETVTSAGRHRSGRQSGALRPWRRVGAVGLSWLSAHRQEAGRAAQAVTDGGIDGVGHGRVAVLSGARGDDGLSHTLCPQLLRGHHRMGSTRERTEAKRGAHRVHCIYPRSALDQSDDATLPLVRHRHVERGITVLYARSFCVRAQPLSISIKSCEACDHHLTKR